MYCQCKEILHYQPIINYYIIRNINLTLFGNSISFASNPRANCWATPFIPIYFRMKSNMILESKPISIVYRLLRQSSVVYHMFGQTSMERCIRNSTSLA